MKPSAGSRTRTDTTLRPPDFESRKARPRLPSDDTKRKNDACFRHSRIAERCTPFHEKWAGCGTDGLRRQRFAIAKRREPVTGVAAPSDLVLQISLLLQGLNQGATAKVSPVDSSKTATN